MLDGDDISIAFVFLNGEVQHTGTTVYSELTSSVNREGSIINLTLNLELMNMHMEFCGSSYLIASIGKVPPLLSSEAISFSHAEVSL